MNNPSSLNEIFEAYKRWVCSNPNVVTDIENAVKWISYFFAGKVSSAPITSEIVYCSCKLLTLFNDQIIRNAFNKKQSTSDTKENIKLAITVLQYCEVFNELLLKWRFGNAGKWGGVFILSLIKGTLSMILLHKYKQMPIPSPPIAVLQRHKYVQDNTCDENDNGSYTLRSGRVIRKVEGSPSIGIRDWQPVKPLNMCLNEAAIKTMTYAEMIHIMKPFVHLVSMKVSGRKSWTPWMLSLSLDLISLKLYSEVELPREDKSVIHQRYAGLLLYLLRTPMYDNYTKDLIESLLILISRKAPITKIICDPVLHYLQHWLDIYFYMWS